MLKQRILTALVLGAILITIILAGSKELFVLFIIIAVFLSAREWAVLCNIHSKLPRLLYSIILTGLMVFLYLAIDSSWMENIPIFGSIWWCFAAVMVFYFQQGKQTIPTNIFLKCMIGACVLIPASLSLIYLFEPENTRYFVLLFFILIWIIDSSAYFIGSRWGKKRLANRVSPGKSLEGFLGSLFAAALFAGIFSFMKGITGIEILWFFVLFIVTAGFSVIGDLFESMFKRHVNMKDSGKLLPGHGGILDRIDSLTAAAPIFVLGLRILEGKI